MKKLYTLTLVLIIMAFLGCEKGMVSFYVNDSSTATIKSTAPINLPFNIPIPTIQSTAEQEYQNHNTAPDLIKQVTLENLTITITNPTNEDFSFLKSIHIYIKKSDGSDKQEIAYLDDINSNAKSISLHTTDVNLVEYLKESSYKLETQVKVKEYLTHDIDIRIDLKFKVLAKVL